MPRIFWRSSKEDRRISYKIGGVGWMMDDTLECKYCYKKLTDCKCNRESILDDSGCLSATKFGYDTIDYSFVKMDNRIVMKIELWNDYIYLDYTTITSLHNVIGNFLDLKDTLEKKRLMNCDCNSCGKKTNNMQEWCDECISNGRNEECDC